MAAPKERHRSWNFDAASAGSVPTEFKAASGEWTVVAEESAPSKPHVLAQTGKSPEKNFNTLFVKEVSARNIDFQVRYRTIGGSIEQGCGVIFRAKDENNYYLYQYNPIHADVRICKVVDGQRVVIYSVEDLEEQTGWQSIRIVTNGERIEGHLFGEVRFSITDRTFAGAGQIGLWTEADAQTQFDDLQLEIMDR